MTATQSLLPILLLMLSVRGAPAAPPSEDIVLATNVVLSLRLPAYERHDERWLSGPPSGGFLSEAQLRLVVRARDGRRNINGGLPVRAPKEEQSSDYSNQEWAERINVEAMRRYREQWEEFRKAPPASPVPVLYQELR